MIQNHPLTEERQAKINRWVTQNYDELTRHTKKALNRYGFYGDDGAAYISKLYDTLLRLAFAADGWRTDLEVLKQSKRRLTGYVQNHYEHYKTHDSVDRLQDTSEFSRTTTSESHTEELPPAFFTEVDEDHQLKLQRLSEAVEAVCLTDYQKQMYESFGEDLTLEAIGEQFGVSHSTVSRNRKQLLNDIREYFLDQGWV